MKGRIASTLSAISRFYQERPIVANVGSCITLGIAGDVLQQQNEPHRQGWDAARTGRIGSLGIVTGPMNHFWYRWLDRAVPKERVFKNIAKKIFLDQTVMAPALLTLFFGTTAMLEGNSLEEAVANIKKKFLPTYIIDCAAWPPVQMINFYFVPGHFRVVYVATATVFWNMFLSYMQNTHGKSLH
eukprot:Clim_evm9s234 gene=Clim_evmTU9s234